MIRVACSLILVVVVAICSESRAAGKDDEQTSHFPHATWWNTQVSSEGCQVIKDPVSFCGDRQRWPLFMVGEGEINALYTHTNDTWVAVVVRENVEDLRRNMAREDFVADAMERAFAWQNIDVEMAEPIAAEIDGREAMTYIGSAASERSPVTAAATVYLGDEGIAVGVVSISEQAMFTESHLRLHREFLSGVHIEPRPE